MGSTGSIGGGERPEWADEGDQRMRENLARQGVPTARSLTEYDWTTQINRAAAAGNADGVRSLEALRAGMALTEIVIIERELDRLEQARPKVADPDFEAKEAPIRQAARYLQARQASLKPFLSELDEGSAVRMFANSLQTAPSVVDALKQISHYQTVADVPDERRALWKPSADLTAQSATQGSGLWRVGTTPSEAEVRRAASNASIALRDRTDQLQIPKNSLIVSKAALLALVEGDSVLNERPYDAAPGVTTRELVTAYLSRYSGDAIPIRTMFLELGGPARPVLVAAIFALAGEAVPSQYNLGGAGTSEGAMAQRLADKARGSSAGTSAAAFEAARPAASPERDGKGKSGGVDPLKDGKAK